MSLYDYHYSIKLSEKDPPFYALIMAAMRKADTDNLLHLTLAFPNVRQELNRRYNAPLGVLEEEANEIDSELLRNQINELNINMFEE